MNKDIFMGELARRLAGMPPAERDAALLFYSELFDEAGPEGEQQVIDELGSPYQVAAKILADFAVDQTLGANNPSSSSNTYSTTDYQWGSYTAPKRRISWLWYLLLGIIAAPVALPVAIGVVAVIFSVLVALLALVISLGAVVVTWVVACVALFFTGVYHLISMPPVGISMVGVSLIMAAIALLILLPVKWVITFLIDIITKGVAHIFSRISGGRRA